MLLQHIINTIESAVPLKWQEAWDNSGLQVGNRNADIQAALLTIDVTESVVREAIDKHCDLIISHHPLIFSPLKTISGNTPQERCVETAIRHNIAIYSSHTCMDSWEHGVSGKMAEKLGISNCRILVDGGQCTMHDDAQDSPIHRLTDSPIHHGLGIIGQLPEPMLFTDFLQVVKNTFGAPVLRYIAPTKDPIRTIAVCGGAGAEFIDDAVRQKADVYITADCKYHEFMDANGRIGLIDMDHWISEHFTRDIYKVLLEGIVPTYIAQEDKSPIKIY
ncbi:MAG: Nif3-like dinuclear metal center hexameric protein [Paludibacteraceae bacterium]|nr:Nif3-like dinuclear metal center hexameric protein [Paludibacteraceae bacterium]